MAERSDRVARLSGFKQRLSAQLVQVRIVRLLRDQNVDLRESAAQIAVAVGRDRARITRGRRHVGSRIAAERRPERVREREELRAHHVVAKLQLGRILLVVIGTLLREVFEVQNALARHRMALQVRIDLVRNEHRIARETIEGFQHAARRLLCRLEEFHSRTIGGFFLGADVRKKRSLNHALRRHENSRRSLADIVVAARARNHRARARKHCENRHRLHIRNLLAAAREMSARDMACFVGEHADDLVRCLRIRQRAEIDEDAPAVGHESVELLVVDNDDFDLLVLQARRLQDRTGIFAQELLGFRVADNRHRTRRRRFLRARAIARRKIREQQRAERERARRARDPCFKTGTSCFGASHAKVVALFRPFAGKLRAPGRAVNAIFFRGCHRKIKRKSA